MSLVLNDEQNMLRDHARGFLSKNAPIAHFRQLRDSKDGTGFSRPLWKEFVDLGWAGILIPPDHGGLGLGHVEVGVVMEELGRTLTPSPFLSTAVLAASAIARAGNEKQKNAYLPKIASGDLIATLAVDEASKHHPEKIALAATRIRQRFHTQGREDLRPRWARRGSHHRRRANLGRDGRYQRNDAVPRRCEIEGHQGRTHADGRYA